MRASVSLAPSPARLSALAYRLPISLTTSRSDLIVTARPFEINRSGVFSSLRA